MPRRRSTRRRYDDDYDYYPRYGRRRGCLGSLQHFFHNALIIFLVGLGSILFFLIILLIAFNFTLFIEILVYALYVAAGVAIIAVIYLIVRLITAMSLRISTARAENAKASQEDERVRQAQAKVALDQEQVYERRAKRTRNEYADQQPEYRPRAARPTVNFQEQRYAQEHYSQEYLVRRSPKYEQEPEPVAALEPEIVIPGMPAKGQVFYYRDYERLLKPGEFIAGIRNDGSAHIAKWADYKVCIILGTSDSGKSNTATEKCVCGVRGGGWLVVCDPGAEKPDSLTRRVAPLAAALMPGTIFAMEHPDCMANVRAVSEEYERRRHGADMSVPIYLIIDEFNRLMRDGTIAKELNKLIETFAQEVRGYNINVILCTQRVTGLAAIRNSVISCIAHRSQPSESGKILPARNAKYTNELAKGQTFVHDENGNVFALQQTLIEAQDVQALADAWQQRSKRSRSPRPTQQSIQSASLPSQAPQRRTTQQPGGIPGNISPQRRTTQQPGNQPGGIPGNIPQRPQQPIPRHPASATWEQVNIPEPDPHLPQPRRAPPAQPIRNQRPDPATDELAPRTLSPDPFDALAALRDQRQQHKKKYSQE